MANSTPPTRTLDFDRDGIPWFQAPVPRWWHRCRPHSGGVLPTGQIGLLVHRCACGAIRFGSNGPWAERNSRRRVARKR